MAASESNSSYRSFFQCNFPKEMEHVYETVQDQLHVAQGGNAPCTVCSEKGSVACDSVWTPEAGVDLLVAGSPCPPFSRQRHKRFADGSVKSHTAFETTMTHLVNVIQVYRPHVAVLEQVMGFVQPICTGSSETPYNRRVSHMMCRSVGV